MRILILLGLVSLSLARYCPDEASLPSGCACEHYGAGGDEEKDSTELYCDAIDQTEFENLTKTLRGYSLDLLQLIGCNFVKLHERAFQNITIGVLDIEDTPINEISRESFAGIPHLREITFRNISLKKVPHFRHISHSLVELNLENNNIFHLDKDEFVDLTNLKDILLLGNNIQSIEEGVFHGLSTLVEVDLAQNNISSVGNWFDFNSTLEYLSLNENEIEELPATFFPSLPNLYELNLNDNNFVNISAEIFKDYVEHKTEVTIELMNNPLICDERLCWLYKYLDSIEVINVLGRCNEPGVFSGEFLEEIGPEDVKCPK